MAAVMRRGSILAVSALLTAVHVRTSHSPGALGGGAGHGMKRLSGRGRRVDGV